MVHGTKSFCFIPSTERCEFGIFSVKNATALAEPIRIAAIHMVDNMHPFLVSGSALNIHSFEWFI